MHAAMAMRRLTRNNITRVRTGTRMWRTCVLVLLFPVFVSAYMTAGGAQMAPVRRQLAREAARPFCDLFLGLNEREQSGSGPPVASCSKYLKLYGQRVIPLWVEKEKLGKHLPYVLFLVRGRRTCFGKSLTHSQGLCFKQLAYFFGNHLEAQTKRP
jgi:hypothetical protein